MAFFRRNRRELDWARTCQGLTMVLVEPLLRSGIHAHRARCCSHLPSAISGILGRHTFACRHQQSAVSNGVAENGYAQL
jgi:hypothetical protein